jgi:hypothetical protein
MTDREAFEQLPNYFFRNLKQQMLRGLIPSETVEEALAPLLENYDVLVSRLPLPLRADFENILKVHPEIAARYGIVIPPSVVRFIESLREDIEDAALAGGKLIPSRHPNPLSAAAALPLSSSFLNEPQAPYGKASPTPGEGRSIIKSNTGAWILLSVQHKPGETRVRFLMREFAGRVSIRFSGRPALHLAQENGGCGEMSISPLLKIFRDVEVSGDHPIVELIEETTA